MGLQTSVCQACVLHFMCLHVSTRSCGTPCLAHDPARQVGMLAAVLGAKNVDEWVAKAQRRQLGLCESCGGVNDPATCSQASCPLRKARAGGQ